MSDLPEPLVPAWRPIKTAPKDTLVLVYHRAGGEIVIAKDDDGWATGSLGLSLRRSDVTHWMPLPAFPEEPGA